MRRSLVGAGCALLLVLTGCTATGDGPAAAPHSPSAPAHRESDPTGVIVHLFQWPWADVARECRETLGPAGVAAVQISPPQEHVVLADQGFPWWQDYQPVSYGLTSRRGDRAALAKMVETCHAAGVEIYADAVINHMTAQLFGVGTGGTKFSRTGYPGYDGAADFHHCGHSIAQWSDRSEVQNCDLLDLADLATERAPVRERIAGYLNDLLSIGVDGFRIDAAKHIPAADLAAITAQLDRPAVIYSEVLFALGDPIQPEEYLPFGAVLEPRYGPDVTRALRFGGSLGALAELGVASDSPALDFKPSARSVVYIDSHDTQRGTSTLTYADGGLHALATEFMLAWPYGTPLVMSSFAFTDFDASPPALPDGTTRPVVCGGSAFVCEHRAVLPMVAFRTATAGAPVTEWWATDDQLGFARAGRGYFALNRAAAPVTRVVQTGLPAGRYRDLLHPAAVVTVDSAGTATLTIPPASAISFIKA
ncbi:alpha-amylase [Allocatelliglobosispora scoriae]|uniref:Alpha-amylase n=1 Tax=Allocatelliglobosispora scoriae TaxID=643052 RepID=A0A841BU47_9ACTN|nr:alpha-amylase family protein [Allocatelliglobosispora scoriae]MBB5870433.1 alpha-amylase [Allocatelliglobosispora scoriae]